QGRVVRLHLIEQTLNAKIRENPVVIMAGGKGQRLYPLTKDRPKPMLEVGGKPILEIILEQCIYSGFSQFHISVNFLKEQIVNHFGDGSRWGVDIQYIEENEPLGTCGALSLLNPLPNKPILMMNGDVLTRVEFAQLMKYHDERACAVTMCVREHITKIPFGVVTIDGETVSGIQEKPDISHFVNTGIYVLDPNIIRLLKYGECCDMPQLVERAMVAGEKVAAFPVHEYWLDIGKPDTLLQADGEWH
ncbi:MAG: NTP transferase domain-containing protein, partial [Nitratireductor sp.]|nr:NTP transferase domain-containing protein [Nitratireductor sp.]